MRLRGFNVIHIEQDGIKLMQVKRSLFQYKVGQVLIQPMEEDVRSALAKLLSRTSNKSVFAISTLSDEKVMIKQLNLPYQLKDFEFFNQLNCYALECLPNPLDQFYYDGEILSRQKGLTQCRFVATRREDVNRYQHLFQKVGLKLVCLSTPMIALEHCARWLKRHYRLLDFALVYIANKKLFFTVLVDNFFVYNAVEEHVEVDAFMIAKQINRQLQLLTTRNISIHSLLLSNDHVQEDLLGPFKLDIKYIDPDIIPGGCDFLPCYGLALAYGGHYVH